MIDGFHYFLPSDFFFVKVRINLILQFRIFDIVELDIDLFKRVYRAQSI
jgi:hypothetical protein